MGTGSEKGDGQGALLAYGSIIPEFLIGVRKQEERKRKVIAREGKLVVKRARRMKGQRKRRYWLMRGGGSGREKKVN